MRLTEQVVPARDVYSLNFVRHKYVLDATLLHECRTTVAISTIHLPEGKGVQLTTHDVGDKLKPRLRIGRLSGPQRKSPCAISVTCES